MKIMRLFGPFSILFAIFGVGLMLVMEFLDNSNLPDYLSVVVCSLWVIGMGCGIKGMIWPERLRWLPVIGFGFNLILLVSSFLA